MIQDKADKRLKAAEDRIAALKKTAEAAEAVARQKTDENIRLTAELRREREKRGLCVALALEGAVAEALKSLVPPVVEGEPEIILVDGHNAIHGLPAKYAKPSGNSGADIRERGRLARDVARCFERTPQVRVQIIFDGPHHQETHETPNVTVVYSGGSGQHRADDCILERLVFFKKEFPEMRLTLVSDDAALRSKAEKRGATVQGVKEFGKKLESGL